MKKIIPVACAFFMAGALFADDMPMMDNGGMMDDMPMAGGMMSNNSDNKGQATKKRGSGRSYRQVKFEKNGENGSNFSRMRSSIGGMNFMGGERNQAEAQIKAKFPTEYAALEKERAALEEKFQALAKKADIKLPLTIEEQMAKIEKFRNEHSKELLEINDLRRSDPAAAMEKMKNLYAQSGIEMPLGGMMGRREEMPQMEMNSEAGKLPENGGRENQFAKLNAELKVAFPKEYADLEKLRKENPREYRTEFQKLVKKYNEKKTTEAAAEKSAGKGDKPVR